MTPKTCEHPRCRRPLRSGQARYCSQRCYRSHFEILNPPGLCKNCRGILPRGCRVYCGQACKIDGERKERDARRAAERIRHHKSRRARLTAEQAEAANALIRDMAAGNTEAETNVLKITVHLHPKRVALGTQDYSIHMDKGNHVANILIDPMAIGEVPKLIRQLLATRLTDKPAKPAFGPLCRRVNFVRWLHDHQWHYDSANRRYHHPDGRMVRERDVAAHPHVITRPSGLERLFDRLARKRK